MTRLKDFLSHLEERTAPVCAFLDGRLYPLLVAIFVVIGHGTGLEFYFNIPIMLSAYFALLFSRSIKPFIPILLTIIYQINYTHAFSDYYLSGAVFVILIVMVSLLALCFIYFFARNILPSINFGSPLMLPLIIFSAAVLLGGAFTDGWVIKNLFYGILQIFAYVLVFYTLYYGLKNEDTSELISYITYVVTIAGLTVFSELLVLYLTSDRLIVDGTVIKEEVHLGWGMWNPIGFILTVTIPLAMRGAMRGKYKTAYLIAAILLWGGAILSMSRNAMLFSTLTVAVCVVIGAIASERRLLFRILLGIGIVGAVGICVLLWDKLPELLSKFLNDNGRYDLWKAAIENFLSAPVFGRGFYGFGMGNVFAAFLPWLAHNTLLEMLSAAGILGFSAYVFYRVKTLVPLFRKRPSFDMLMLYLPIFVTLGMSLIDNYVFHIYTTFTYSVCLALIFKLDGERRS